MELKTAIDVLKQCTVEGMIVKLPAVQLDRKLYTDTKNKLELIGGKWKGGKTQGFEFKEDPTSLLEDIAGGENRNLKKEYQFFGTPDPLADRLVELAEIESTDEVLEPSAGQGALIKAMLRGTVRPAKISYCELMELNQKMLKSLGVGEFVQADFTDLDDSWLEVFDKIVANPPFTKNQDIDHIGQMYRMCRPGGRIVSMASTSWQFGSQKKQVDFKEWLDEIGAEVIQVGRGAFKESGTEIPTVIIIINK